MNRSASDVQNEIAASRAALDQDLDALKQKMAPDRLMRDARGRAAAKGQAMASRLAAQARANPLPLAIAGVALSCLVAWRAAAGVRKRRMLGQG